MQCLAEAYLTGAAGAARRGGRLRYAVAAACAVFMATACSNGVEVKALQGEAIGEMLQSVASDSVVRLASGDTLRVSRATVEFYRDRRWSPAWIGPSQPLEQGTALHEAVGSAWEDGLPPARYRHDVASDVIARLEAAGDARLPDSLTVYYLADLDVLLTEGFNRLARDLMAGMLDPSEARLDYRIAAEPPAEGTPVHRVLAGERPTALVAELRPSLPQYDRTRSALLAFHEAKSRGGWPRVRGNSALPALKKGDRDDAITQVRERFLAGVDAEELTLARTGAGDPTLFDAELEMAVKQFQERHAIASDGEIGAATIKELNHTVEERITELRLNLDRWRWLPNDLGETYVLVNIAGFELEVVDHGRVVESMNVVVGQQAHETPLFSDSIRFVVVNPYWNVPDGIMERTIRPGMARDPNYLANHDMEMVDGGVREDGTVRFHHDVYSRSEALDDQAEETIRRKR